MKSTVDFIKFTLSKEEEKELFEMLKETAIQDEMEYCFDRSYTDDEHWKQEYGNETRTRAFSKAVYWISEMSIHEFFYQYGDKYDFLVEHYAKENVL